MSLVILVSLLGLLPMAEAHTFVGNGGQGVEYRGQLFVRDVFDPDGAVPYLGESSDAGIEPLPDLWSEIRGKFPYPKALLARKLADLNQLRPGLGDYVLSALRLYRWHLGSTIAPLPFDQDASELPPGAALVQLAVRSENNIWVDEAQWRRLTDEQQVVLLVHEAVYSLSKPKLGPNGLRHQWAGPVRQLVRGLFLRESLEEKSRLLRQISSLLALPGADLPYSELRRRPAWAVRIFSADGPMKEQVLIENVAEFNWGDNPGYPLFFLREACRSVGEPWHKRAVRFLLESEYRSPSIIAKLHPFRIDRAGSTQLRVLIQRRKGKAPRRIRFLRIGDNLGSECEATFAPHTSALLRDLGEFSFPLSSKN